MTSYYTTRKDYFNVDPVEQSKINAWNSGETIMEDVCENAIRNGLSFKQVSEADGTQVTYVGGITIGAGFWDPTATGRVGAERRGMRGPLRITSIERY